MRDDTREELERLEKELLDMAAEEDIMGQEDASVDDILDDALLREVLAEPAFEDPDQIHEPKEPLVYCNYSNDYGRDLKEFAENGGKTPASKDDKISTALMFTASALCLGIIGVLIYWLNAYL